jgi:DNA-directed RNA polymerase
VAKIPAGLRSVEPGDPIPAPPSPTDPTASTTIEDSDNKPDVSAVISELEEEDGSDSLSIFAQSKKIKRVPASIKTPWDDLDAEDEDGGSGAVWKSTSKKTDSKLLYLADVLPPAPSKGDFDLNLVRSSPYL